VAPFGVRLARLISQMFVPMWDPIPLFSHRALPELHSLTKVLAPRLSTKLASLSATIPGSLLPQIFVKPLKMLPFIQSN
jgi:hypothetical protein